MYDPEQAKINDASRRISEEIRQLEASIGALQNEAHEIQRKCTHPNLYQRLDGDIKYSRCPDCNWTHPDYTMQIKASSILTKEEAKILIAEFQNSILQAVKSAVGS